MEPEGGPGKPGLRVDPVYDERYARIGARLAYVRRFQAGILSRFGSVGYNGDWEQKRLLEMEAAAYDLAQKPQWVEGEKLK